MYLFFFENYDKMTNESYNCFHTQYTYIQLGTANDIYLSLLLRWIKHQLELIHKIVGVCLSQLQLSKLTASIIKLILPKVILSCIIYPQNWNLELPFQIPNCYQKLRWFWINRFDIHFWYPFYTIYFCTWLP